MPRALNPRASEPSVSSGLASTAVTRAPTAWSRRAAADPAHQRRRHACYRHHREHAARAARRQRSRIAHEDFRRVTVEPEEADGRADERAEEHGQLARALDVENLQIVGGFEVA